MKKRSTFKKRYFIIIMPIIFFIIFYCWKEYQQSTRKVVDIDEISNVKVLLEENQNPSKAIIEGSIGLKKFEKISTFSAIQKEGVIYVFITKTKGISNKSNFKQPISKVLFSHSSDTVKEIALISGDNIIVHNETDPTRSHIEVSNYEKIKIIWKP